MYVLVICEKSGLVVMFCLLDVGEANLASSVRSSRSWLENECEGGTLLRCSSMVLCKRILTFGGFLYDAEFQAPQE